eukprot:gene10574-3093_t
MKIIRNPFFRVSKNRKEIYRNTSIIDEDEIFFKTTLPFKQILTKPTLTKYFYEFSKKERNVKALDFYLQLLRYQNLKTKEERSEEKIINDKYLDVNSKYAINISVENILSVKQRSEEAPIDLYDTLQKEMEVLMMDSYRRFFKTPAYEEMLTNHQIDKKIKIFDEAEEDNHTYQLTSPGIALRAVGKKNDFGMQSFRSLKEIEKTSAVVYQQLFQFCRFINPTTIVLCGMGDISKYNYKPGFLTMESESRMNLVFDILRNQTDQDGNKFDIIRIPFPECEPILMDKDDVTHDTLSQLYDSFP